MIGDDIERGPRFPCGGHADTVLASGDQGGEEIRVEIAPHTLQDGRHAFETHAGVDRGLRQVDSLIGAHLLVLHEHQVPEFEEAVTVLVLAARRPALEFGSLIDEDLRTGTTGTGIAHRPEVVRCRDSNDPVIAESRHTPPQGGSLFVGGVHRDEKAVAGKPEDSGHQVPGEFDRVVLEVVAEREVAQHLEEGVMTGRETDNVEIVVLAAGAHAFLGRGGAAVGTLLDSGEDVLELHHAGVGEEQRRVVVRHERTRLHGDMVMFREEVEERGTDLTDAGHHPPAVLSGA